MSDRSFYYDVEYDDGFREQVADGDVNPLCGLRIVVDGEDIAGAPPDESFIDDYLFYHFRKIVTNVPEVLDGNRTNVQLYSSSDYIVLDPTDDVVLVSLQSPTELTDESSQDGRAIPKQDLVAGIVEAVEEFCSQLASVDPDLTENEHIVELRDSLSEFSQSE